jgi:hypothetical protein
MNYEQRANDHDMAGGREKKNLLLIAELLADVGIGHLPIANLHVNQE